MINTQRMSSMAFSIKDGLVDPETLTRGQRTQAIRCVRACVWGGVRAC